LDARLKPIFVLNPQGGLQVCCGTNLELLAGRKDGEVGREAGEMPELAEDLVAHAVERPDLLSC